MPTSVVFLSTPRRVRLRAEVQRVKEGPHVQGGATQGQLTDRWIWVPAGRVLRRAGRRAVQGRP